MKDYVVIIEAHKKFSGGHSDVRQEVVIITTSSAKDLTERISRAKFTLSIHGHQPDYYLVKHIIEMEHSPSNNKLRVNRWNIIKKSMLTIGVISLTVLASWGLYFIIGDAASLIGVLGGYVCFTIWDN